MLFYQRAQLWRVRYDFGMKKLEILWLAAEQEAKRVNSEMSKPSPFPTEVLDQLLDGTKTPEEMFGSDGLLQQLTKALVERSLHAELTHHLGYEKHDPGVSDILCKRLMCTVANSNELRHAVTQQDGESVHRPMAPEHIAWELPTTTKLLLSQKYPDIQKVVRQTIIVTVGGHRLGNPDVSSNDRNDNTPSLDRSITAYPQANPADGENKQPNTEFAPEKWTVR